MTSDRIEKLEDWRNTNGLKKSFMARYFDVPPRNYNNWVYRGSLPKEHYDRADALLGAAKGRKTSPALVLTIDAILARMESLPSKDLQRISTVAVNLLVQRLEEHDDQ